MATERTRTIRELREARGMSVADVGRRIGARDEDIRRWESGGGELDLGRLRRLAQAFGVSPDEVRLEPHRRHLTVQGYCFVLDASGHESRGWTARIGLVDPIDATGWAHRPIDPDDPHAASPSVLQGWRATGATRDEALDALADRITAAMEKALHPSRLPDDPDDWAPRPRPDWFPARRGA